MKSRRLRAILTLIEQKDISTQEELSEYLKEEIGIDVTQATISRDIKELGLIKIPIGKEASKYALPGKTPYLSAPDRLRRLFKETVTKIDYSLNTVVVRTLPGHAHAVASGLDSYSWTEVLGTVAGDDTIFIVIKPPEAVEEFVAKINSWLAD